MNSLPQDATGSIGDGGKAPQIPLKVEPDFFSPKGGEVLEASAGEIVARLKRRPARPADKRRTPLAYLGRFRDDHRLDANLIATYGAAFDLDNVPGAEARAEARCIELGLSYLLYTTYSHGAEKESAWRLLVFYSEAVPPGRWLATYQATARLLDIFDDYDRGAEKPAQGFAVPLEGCEMRWNAEGGPVDVDSLEPAPAKSAEVVPLQDPLAGGVFSFDVQAAPAMPAERAPVATDYAVEGSRNDSLASLVGHYVREGLPVDELIDKALEWNRRNVPPMSEQEAMTTIRSVLRSAAANGDAPAPVVAPVVESFELEPQEVSTAIREIDTRPILSGIYQRDSVDWLIDQWLPRAHVTLFTGHGGSGKSQIQLAVCCHVAAGVPYAGMAVEQGRAVFVSFEDEERVLVARVAAICAVFGLDLAKVLDNLVLLDASHTDGELAGEDPRTGQLVMGPRFKELCDLIESADLIVIDNASDTYGGGESVRRQVRKFIRQLRLLAVRHHAALVLLAHIDKVGAKFGTSGNSYSGSTAWHNSVRSRLALVADKSGLLCIEHEKSNHGPLCESVPLHWVDGVAMPTTFDAVKTATELQRKADAERLLELIATATKHHDLAPNSRSANYIGKVITHIEGGDAFGPTDDKGAAGTEARKRLDAAVMALIEAGRVRVEEYRTDSRGKARRLVIATPAHTVADAVETAKQKGEPGYRADLDG